MVSLAFNPSTWEAKAGGFLSFRTAKATLRNPVSEKKKTKKTKKPKQKKKRGKKKEEEEGEREAGRAEKRGHRRPPRFPARACRPPAAVIPGLRPCSPPPPRRLATQRGARPRRGRPCGGDRSTAETHGPPSPSHLHPVRQLAEAPPAYTRLLSASPPPRPSPAALRESWPK